MAVHVFGEDVTAVDANVRRVVSRFFDVHPDVVEAVADAIAPAGRSGDFLHGILDFAAEVCTARSPACRDCPLEEHRETFH